MAAVVLAGGQAVRYGSDKLAAELHGRTVLDRALDDLPPEAEIVVVGPRRALDHRADFVRERPPGGGPAAAMITGLCWALERQAELIVTLPGDAPSAGGAAVVLLAALTAGDADGVIGVDRSGRDQVLQLALRPVLARQLVELAGSAAGHGQSVRRLITALDPPPRRVDLPDELTQDVDTPTDLEHLRNQHRA